MLIAACVKIGVKPPKDAEQLYEVDQQGSVVRGSRKMQHSNQLRCAATHLSAQQCAAFSKHLWPASQHPWLRLACWLKVMYGVHVISRQARI